MPGSKNLINMLTHQELIYKLQCVLKSVKVRCYCPTNRQYHQFGGRGITVCPQWMNGGGQDAFIAWALSSGYRPGLCLSLVDKYQPYSPANCMWIPKSQTTKVRTNNRMVRYRGQRMKLNDLIHSVHPGCSSSQYSAICNRIETMKWEIEAALLTPIGERMLKADKYNVRRLRPLQLA